MFYDILERKNAFLGYKNKKSKKSKNWHFSKGFGPKMAICPTFFFLRNVNQENVFYDILERRNGFLGCKNKKFNKSKKLTFFQKGQPMVLVQKWALFKLFF